MKTKESMSRSEKAKHEARNAQGQFTADSKSNMSHSSNKSSGHPTDHRGENAKNEPRDSHGRFQSEGHKNKK